MTKQEQLRFLIAELQKEMPEYAAEEAPKDEAGAFELFRALANLRMPGAHKLPEAFYAAEAEVLRAITREKGVTDGESLVTVKSDPRLAIWQGDITTLKVDAIVNAANSQMLGCFVPRHYCIDNAIHTMAGVELREKCLEIMRAQGHEEPAGQAKITSGYNLPAKYVLHTVGPIVSGPLTMAHRSLLSSCYRACLSLAAEYGCHTVAFCCISTGVFHFPPPEAAAIAVKTVRPYLDDHPATACKVIFNVFTDSDRRLYEAILEK